MEQKRKVMWIYQKSGRKQLIKDNLTLDQARKMVKGDEDKGASTKVKMMIYEKM
tara:strand:- start:174 stop:335 length:162 start_codon:yes stop_codon:yes gene_type:complete